MPTPDPQPTAPWTVLVLSRFPEKIVADLARFEDELIFSRERVVTPEFLDERDIDAIVCFGYERILTPGVLARVTAINVHQSLLPLCRGPFPHLWTIAEGAPFGVTVHYIDESIDTGDLIAQRLVEIDDERTTFQESFDRLIDESAQLLGEAWPGVRLGINARMPQPAGGSSHTRRDNEPLEGLLTEEALSLTVAEFRRRAAAILEREVSVEE